MSELWLVKSLLFVKKKKCFICDFGYTRWSESPRTYTRAAQGKAFSIFTYSRTVPFHFLAEYFTLILSAFKSD
jgi:hypothetical protein